MPTLTLNMSKADVVAALRQLPALLVGRGVDPTGAVRALQLAMGIQALTIIKEAFLVKSRGGTDEAGDSWQPLSPRTLAYSRRHPGLPPSSKRKPRPLLTKAEDERWRRIFAQTWRSLLAQGVDDSRARGCAAGYAWKVLKASGAQTLLLRYGTTQVDIGRDTGIMFNSLSPGIPGSVPDQMFEVSPGQVVVGTKIKYAEYFHKKRPLWPDGDRWPTSWMDRLAEVLGDGVELLTRKILGAP